MQYKHPLLRALVLMAFVILFLVLMLQPHIPFHISLLSQPSFISSFSFSMNVEGSYVLLRGGLMRLSIVCPTIRPLRAMYRKDWGI